MEKETFTSTQTDSTVDSTGADATAPFDARVIATMAAEKAAEKFKADMDARDARNAPPKEILFDGESTDGPTYQRAKQRAKELGIPLRVIHGSSAPAELPADSYMDILLLDAQNAPIYWAKKAEADAAGKTLRIVGEGSTVEAFHQLVGVKDKPQPKTAKKDDVDYHTIRVGSRP